MLVGMKRLPATVALALCACGHQPNAQEAIDTAKSVLAGVDFAAEQAAPAIDAGREIAFERCADRETPAEREACLGPLAEPLEPIARKASQAYNAILENLDKLGEALADIERLKGAAEALKKGAD